MRFFKLLLVFFIVLTFTGCKKEKFSLDKEYYNQALLLEIDNKKLEDLIKNKNSFVIFIYQPLCETSRTFESILNDFTTIHDMTFYKIAFSNIKNTNLGKKIKYYPSFVIYKNGKIVDFLEADNDEDIWRYKNIDKFRDWLFNYVEMKEVNI